MQTIVTETGQYVLQQSEVLTALGIPSNAALQSVVLNADGTITFIASVQISNTGTP